MLVIRGVVLTKTIYRSRGIMIAPIRRPFGMHRTIGVALRVPKSWVYRYVFR